ncbi:reverse transcriptase domain-containing protein, partial [Vibrio parahaemolyticus]|nr:reverse transcriptase domain-containing protein [Vibrio parahaemolyticus]
RPGYLKALDVVGLSWLTRLCSIAWTSGAVPLEWQTGVGGPIFKKGDQRVCSNYRGITLLSLPGKIYSRVLEKRVRSMVEPQIEEEQCGFCPRRGTVDQLFTLARVLEGAAPSSLVPSSSDLQLSLRRFIAECEAAGMRISTSKSEAMVLSRKRVDCPLQVRGEVLPQVEEFKYLGVLFTSEGRMEREI